MEVRITHVTFDLLSAHGNSMIVKAGSKLKDGNSRNRAN